MKLLQPLFFALLLIPNVSTLPGDSPASQSKPNIVFNLADDLGEKSNLVEFEPERALSLQRVLFAWQKEVGAKSLEANKKFDHSKPNGRFAARPKSSTIP